MTINKVTWNENVTQYKLLSWAYLNSECFCEQRIHYAWFCVFVSDCIQSKKFVKTGLGFWDKVRDRG